MAALHPAQLDSNDTETTHRFVDHLPRFQAHAAYALRHIHCPETRSDLVAETIALAWKRFLALVRRGKDPTQFVTTLAHRCSQAVRSGRRLVGSERSTDALSRVGHARHGFKVESLHDQPNEVEDDDLTEALIDNTRSRVPDQVAFRIDFPRWRRGLGVRNRHMLDALMVGEGTSAVADRFGLSPARVSQLRGEFEQSWDAFQDCEVDA